MRSFEAAFRAYHLANFRTCHNALRKELCDEDCSRNRGRLPLVEALSTTVRGSPGPFGSQGMTLSMTWIPHYFWSRKLGFTYR